MKAKAKQRPPAPHRHRVGDLVLTRFGGGGSQVARVLGLRSDAALYRITRWRANSARWTAPRWIPARHVVGVPEAGDPRRAQIALADEKARVAAC
jgi:hypothetical protein